MLKFENIQVGDIIFSTSRCIGDCWWLELVIGSYQPESFKTYVLDSYYKESVGMDSVIDSDFTTFSMVRL